MHSSILKTKILQQFNSMTKQLVLLATMLAVNVGFAQPITELANDGTWCWFSDPRAIYLPQNGGKLVTGYVSEDGSVIALQHNVKSGETQSYILNKKLEVDDHNNPAFVQRADGHILAFYTKHHNTDLYMHVSKKPYDASEWEPAITINPNGKADVEKYGDNKYTYANPFVLSEENNRIYLFGRWIGFKPNFSWSDDGGKTWAEGRVVVSPQPFSWGQRPYVKYFSDGKDKIHMVFTDGHPRDEKTNSVYYAYYKKGSFYRANGEQICTIEQLPFEPKDATLVYDAKTTGHRAWVYDIVADKKGNPAIAYARYPSETEHIYHYAYFTGEKWIDQKLCNSGKWFPSTPQGKKEREPHYSGGMTIAMHEPHTLYVAIENENLFEIEKWTFNPKKQIWKNSLVTLRSQTNQVRPYVAKDTPKKTGTLLLWLSVDRYVHYTDYRTRVMLCQPNKK
jgi:hypothetical protein